MTRIIFIIFISLFALTLNSCEDDKDTNLANITLNFSHTWDATPITSNDFNAIKFNNANGDLLSIAKLRYLISEVTFHKTDGSVLILEGYNLVDLTNDQNLSFTPITRVPLDTYADITFTFGFNNENNIDGVYTDLNSTSWNVPAILGGGYHYMQFDGKFVNNTNEEQGFNYHAIRAVDNAGDNPTFPQDTFFNVSLGPTTITNNTVVNIDMNIAEWFKNPNTWDINILNQVLMPNSEAQIMMFENGKNVFTLKSIE